MNPIPPPTQHTLSSTSTAHAEPKEKKGGRREKVSKEDAASAQAFKMAVQGKKPGAEGGLLGLLNSSPAAVAAAMGLPVGLIRTSEANESITEQYATSLFGASGEDNPAKRARLRRENSARQAVERARQMLAERRQQGQA
jgi:hypothetical protein